MFLFLYLLLHCIGIGIVNVGMVNMSHKRTIATTCAAEDACTGKTFFMMTVIGSEGLEGKTQTDQRLPRPFCAALCDAPLGPALCVLFLSSRIFLRRSFTSLHR